MRLGIVTLTIAFSTIAILASSAQQPYSPPPASAEVLARIPFQQATPVDEAYRAEFDKCDRENVFEGKTMRNSRRCSTDPNRVKALLKFPNGTVFFESKLSLDIDGSWKACNAAGATDQCHTWYKWKGLPEATRNVDADKYPYVVIPIANVNGSDNKKFRVKTGIAKGDLGVVVFKDRIVPVFVADGGPHNKMGEGSTALLKAIGEDRCKLWHDGHCEEFRDVSVPGGVLVFLFPNSNIPDLTPANALEKINAEALRRFEALKTAQ